MTARLDEECPMAGVLATKLRESKRELTSQWLGRIADRITLDENRIFPTDELLDHVPLLIDGVADYVENPAAEVGVDMPVVSKAMELGALRHRQGFDAYEILKEYEFLGGILFTFFSRVVGESKEPCENGELMACGFRLYRALTIIQQSTMGHFLVLADKNVSEREERLRGVNRVISHEIKNRIGAVLGASSVLHEVTDIAASKRVELVEIIRRNAREMRNTVDNVLALSRTEADDVRHHRHVMLAEAVREASRQVREAAQFANIDIGVNPDMPEIEVSAAVIELCIKNYLSNAIKYADPAKSRRTVEISGAIEETESGEREIVVRVCDNGLGVPTDRRDQLFERFYRAHESTSKAEGTGLGLSIVRETAESQGGRAWAEYPEEGGTVFAIALPLHREPDAPETRRGAERSPRSE